MKKQVLFQNDNFLARRADGTPDIASAGVPTDDTDDTTAMAATQAYTIGQLIAGGPLGRKPGITVGSWFVSAELLVMTATLVTIIVGLCKRR